MTEQPTHFLPLTAGPRYVLVTDLTAGRTYSAAEQHGWLLSLDAGDPDDVLRALVYAPWDTPAPVPVRTAQILRRYPTWDRAISAARTEQEPESA